MISVIIIGSGNMAHALILSCMQANLKIIGIHSRTPEKAILLAQQFHIPYFSTFEQLPANANFYLLCVNDNVIAQVASQLHLTDGLVVHFSGIKPIAELQKHTNQAVFWPIESVNKNTFVNFNNTPICIEANNEQSYETITSFASKFTNQTVVVTGLQRQYMHMAATVTNNFSNHLIALAKKELDFHQLDYHILRNLLTNSISNSFKFEPENIQTGAAVRNDTSTMQTHLDLILNSNLKELYLLMSKSIFELKKQNHA